MNDVHPAKSMTCFTFNSIIFNTVCVLCVVNIKILHGTATGSRDHFDRQLLGRYSVDQISQIDIAVLDLNSKAFDTVPSDGLLSKLKHYSIDDNIWLWISNFLKQHKQRVVVDGIQSDLVTVDSGVPQGTFLGPILFLLHINDLPSVISSKVRLFADVMPGM